MRIELEDPSYVAGLVSFLRERSCIAYVLDDQSTIEVLRPGAFGLRETQEIGAILRTWQIKNPEARLSISG
jgi:hypothetical protein